jgi:pimeloyl-ACP methyl ester carboxylesterase
MSFLDRSVDVNGINLHYVEWGDAGAPPLVLLHGITGHARTWDRLASGLVSRWHIIALDQRGHGDSDVAPDGDYGVGPMAGRPRGGRGSPRPRALHAPRPVDGRARGARVRGRLC